MKYEIGYQPSYSLAIMRLEPGESIRCESGAMVSMSAELKLEAKMNAGSQTSGFFGRALGALKRSVLGGESFFITTVSAPTTGGELTLAPAVPGDISAVEMGGKTLIVSGGNYLASGPGVEIDTQWAGLKGLLGGEGLFFLRINGTGTTFITSFGAIHRKTLNAGERYVVDSGHMVAFQEGMQMQTRMADAEGGFFKRALTSATTGEGLVMEFTGPGEIWMQTRNPQAFSGWIQGMLPQQSSGGSSAASGVTAGGIGAALGSMLGGSDD
jgi:uncharacterized protein (TIGR00266 family)